MGKLHLVLALVLAWPWLTGFDFSKHKIPPEEILSGGPPKDGIPAIHAPRFVPAIEATFLDDDDRVIGVARGGVAKAYPLSILNWHEVVNDEAGGDPLAVTYCPLTGSGIVYDRRIGDREVTFGVSGRLYQSNVLLYDRATESLWSQIQEEAVTGEMTGTRLEAVPSVDTTWARWKAEHPRTLVLSPDTGFSRPYDRDPYEGYRRSPDVLFPTSRFDRRLPPKEWVVGVRVGDATIAFPKSRLDAAKETVAATVGGKSVRVEWDAATETAVVTAEGKPHPAYTGYWFAWYAFHPSTAVWGAAAPEPGAKRSPLPVAIVEHEGGWADLLGPGGDGLQEGGSFFQIKGRLRNDTGKPLGFVRLSYELVAESGEVVWTEHGYNRRAENLRDEDFEAGRKPFVETGVEPIPAGGTDTFRMFFFRDELPAFATYRVRVEAVGEASGRVASEGK